MLDTKDRPRTTTAMPRLDRLREVGEQGRPEMVVVIGLVALVSMAFGFVLGLLF
jgi:hypothetical protein